MEDLLLVNAKTFQTAVRFNYCAKLIQLYILRIQFNEMNLPESRFSVGIMFEITGLEIKTPNRQEGGKYF